MSIIILIMNRLIDRYVNIPMGLRMTQMYCVYVGLFIEESKRQYHKTTHPYYVQNNGLVHLSFRTQH